MRLPVATRSCSTKPTTRASCCPLNEKGSESLPARAWKRTIGVIYRPQTVRASHYFHARLNAQFDAVIHIDRTSAMEALERALWDQAELPERFPTGL